MKENTYSVEEFGIKIERFLRKNKFIIIFIIIAIIAYFAFNSINDSIKIKNTKEANSLYNELLITKDNDKLNQLKSLNPNLYLALLMDEKYIEELATFKPSNEDKLLLEIYKAKEFESGIFLKDLRTIQEAYELLQANKIEEARVKLDLISANSVFYKVANSLKHYQGNK